MAITNKEKYEQLLKSIDWENYRLSGGECDEQHQYMDLCKVLHKKINDIQIQLMLLLHKDSVDMVDELVKVKTLLSLLNEEKLKNII